MKRNSLILIITLITNFAIFAQNDVIITIGDETITHEEFLRFYHKNNDLLTGQNNTLSPQQYMQLFINYKLKVMEAERLKMDTVKNFQNELENYKEQLVKPLLTYNDITKDKIREIYNRTTKEVDAGHILFSLPQNASAVEEDSVYQKAINIRKELLKGTDFSRTAIRYSQDPSARKNGGRLGYFTAFQMVKPFEDAAFNTEIGSISMPVKTRFGYHLIKVYDVRDSKGQVQVAHIMKMFPQNATAEQKALKKEEIENVQQILLNGADFDMVVQSYSDDKKSAQDGGVLPPFYAHQMPKEFSEQAFSLKHQGQVSKPFATDFGYHIIKKIKDIPVPSYEESKAKIERQLKNNPQFKEQNKRIFINNLKKENNYKEYNKQISKSIREQTLLKNEKLFSFKNIDYDTNDFQNYLNNTHQTTIDLATFNNWVDFEITNWKRQQLLTHNSNIKNTIREYHDGILLFNIMKEKIWDFAAADSAGLEAFYKQNPDKYFWKNRFNGYLITCDTKKICKKVKRDLKKKKTIALLKEKYNAKEEKIKIFEGKWSKGNNSIIDHLVYNKSGKSTINTDNIIIKGNIVEKEAKTLDEARGSYLSDYQDYLDKKWIKTLREDYQVSVNQALLNTISKDD